MTQHDVTGDRPTQARRPEDTPTVLIDEHAKPPASPRAPELTPGTLLGERYRIVSLLGRGGMGVVYRADDLKLGQTIAVKFLAKRGRQDARLYEEVRIGREVAHPNVCRLYDIAEIDGHLFITMEFVGGEDLSSLLRRVGRLPAEKAQAVARDVASGLAAAHEKGIIHRDLKPANVLIDGRGRAHISDFGLAVAEERKSGEVSAGTPAYMAPEQLSGEPATIQSDVYALGLVLYEVVTGTRPFGAATTTRELATRQLAADFPRPTSVVRDIDPAMERIIVRCLDPDPDRRPQSVEEILQQMPGRDALSAAVEAGETPSPEMVSAAAERGDLSVRNAAILLLITVAGVVLYALLTSRTMLYRRLPGLKSAEVLEDRAREIIAATEQSAPNADWDEVFYANRDERERRGGTASATSLLFLYRQSPRPLVTSGIERRVMRNDPPLNVSGMADVTLDSAGHLVEMIVVAPQVSHSVSSTAPDWTPYFRAAGIQAPWRPVPPEWAAPVDSDRKQAWSVSGARRVEAASYEGKPVWFAVIYPWTRPDRMMAVNRSETFIVATVVLIAFLIVLPIVAIFLARRNIRRKRVDRRGAFRFAIFTLIVAFGASLFRAHHVASFVPEWELLSRLTVDASFWALIAWIAYVAIEPLVRRRWPRMLIGWSRLLDGRATDPIIGRDLLIGMVAGIAIVIAWQLSALTPGASLLQMTTTPLSGARHVAYYILFGLLEATMRALGLATLLLALHASIKSGRVALAVSVVLLALSFIDDPSGPIAIRVAYALFAATIVIMVAFRYGLVAVASSAYTILLLRNLPITTDPNAWYFGRSALAVILLLVLAAFGFAASVGGKRWIPDLAFD